MSWMKFFPSPLLSLFFLLFITFSFFLLQGMTRGHCLGMVTRDDSVNHEYFCRNDKSGS
jgi:hypothetical protein